MKKKILIIPTYFPTKSKPILGSQVKEQTELITDTFDIKVLYCINKGNISKKRYYFEKLLVKLNIKKSSSCDQEVLCDDLSKLGEYYYHVNGFSEQENFEITIQAYAKSFMNLINEGWIPDLIHARTAEHAGIITHYLSQKFSIPYVVTENCALLYDHTFSTFKMNSYFKSLEGAIKVAFVSNYLLKLVVMHGKEIRGEVIGNMIDDFKFSILNNLKAKSSAFRILTAGYNSYIKDFNTFYKSIKQLIDIGYTNINVTHLVTYFWSEENKNELVNLIKDYNLDDYCELKYQVPRSEMPFYFNNADVFVSTSLTETFGIAACEALFCGVPVVTTANGGIDDFISDLNGLKVPLMDYKSVAIAIKSIIDNDVIFDPEQVRLSVLKKFGRSAFKAKLISFYNSAISESKL